MSITREAGPLKWNLNTILTIVGACVTVLTQVVVFTVLWVNQTRDIQDTNERINGIYDKLNAEATDRKDRIKSFTDAQSQMKQELNTISTLSFQVSNVVTLASENKEGIKQTNARIDRVVESFGGKLDNVLDSVNKLSASIAVINSKLEIPRDRTQPTLYKTPIIQP